MWLLLLLLLQPQLLQVRMLGADAAVVSYVRLQQKVDSKTLRPVTLATEETRVWQRKDGKWRNVHFHRSPPSAP